MVAKEKYSFTQWDSDNDILSVNRKALLPISHPDVSKRSPWAYSLNTAKGFYFMHTENIPQSDTIKLPNGENITISHTEQVTYLCFADTETTKNLFRDVTVWAHNFYKDFMIITLHETDQTFLIDSRGEPFELPINNIHRYHNGSVIKDKRKGYYVIENVVIIRYRTKEEQANFEDNTDANIEAIFNKDFNRFSRANANNTAKYLYLTAGNSKCGALVNHFIKQGMQCEIVPNVLVDDETLNIRIPLEGINATRKDVHFLCAKYSSTYSIYNIPYTEIINKLELTQTQKEKYKKSDVFSNGSWGSGHETISYFIINTFRSMFNTNDDYVIYKKVFAKIVRLLARGYGELEHNYFSDLLLLHPKDHDLNEKYVSQKKEYIETLLFDNNYPSWEEICKEQESHFLFSKPTLSINNAYRYAYDCAKSQFKKEMSSYESDIIYQITQSGGTVSKWKSEATLFTLVKKEYPDAIYQYHSSWLGLQSLDIFIPSLNIAIEYQGEQHYRPIEIFGGEDAFKDLVIRDKRKAMLCRENHVSIIYWKYDEVISINRLKKKIHDVKPQL